jgi:predicted nucleic acid-binding protein
MTLGDALIGATAITNDLTLVTRNVDDFDWIEGLQILDPLASA